MASESMITLAGTFHRCSALADEKQAADAAAKLKTTADPRKWICVGVDEAKVASKGKLVCVCDGRRKRAITTSIISRANA